MTSIQRLLIAGIVACTLAGCGDANRAKIIGTWGIDSADNVMSRINQDTNEDALDEPDEPRLQLVFHRNGKLETKTAMGEVSSHKTGVWVFASYDEPSQLMKISCDIQSQKTEHEIVFVDDQTIKLIPPNMAGTNKKLKFKRR